MLRCWGGSSHVIQAIAQPLGVELPGLFAIGHCCPTLATFPSVRDQEFWQLLLHEHGLAQVGFSFCFHRLHRLTDLALNHYGSRTPTGFRPGKQWDRGVATPLGLLVWPLLTQGCSCLATLGFKT